MAEEQKTEVKEAKRFSNKLLAFPKTKLDEIDGLIQKQYKADFIRKFLVNNYNGPLPIPNRLTIAAYVKWRQAEMKAKLDAAARIRKELEPTESEIRELMARLNVAGMDISDRKIVLEKLVVFLLSRIQILSQVQDTALDPRFEQNITNQVAEVHAMTQTLLKLEGQLGVHEAVARLIVEKFLYELAPIVRKAAEDTYGSSKTSEFLERLQKGYRTIDFERIRNESVVEVSVLSKETGDTKKPA